MSMTKQQVHEIAERAYKKFLKEGSDVKNVTWGEFVVRETETFLEKEFIVLTDDRDDYKATAAQNLALLDQARADLAEWQMVTAHLTPNAAAKGIERLYDKWKVAERSLDTLKKPGAVADATVSPFGSISKDSTAIRARFQTKGSNQIEVFYNHSTGLLIVSLVAKSGRGGNEIVRKMLDTETELRLLAHTEKKGKKV